MRSRECVGPERSDVAGRVVLWSRSKVNDRAQRWFASSGPDETGRSTLSLDAVFGVGLRTSGRLPN